MAVIKFDSEKADTLIKDLTQISSDIESNLGKVYTNTYGKEINLNDSRLKVYAFRDKVIEMVQEDGTVVEETIREQYLKNDYVSNARAYNQHVRNMYRKSNTAKTNATKAIESVVNSLKEIKNLINEFETEQGLTLAKSLEDVGSFDFNFLSAYGPMTKPDNYSPSFGTIVVDEAFTSKYLGMLGERPTSINLEKLSVFDNILGIARNKELSYDEQLAGVRELLMENVLEVDSDNLVAKTKEALDSMIGIMDAPDLVVDDTLKIETLIKFNIPVIEDLRIPSLTTEPENATIFDEMIAAGGTIIGAALPGAKSDDVTEENNAVILPSETESEGRGGVISAFNSAVNRVVDNSIQKGQNIVSKIEDVNQEPNPPKVDNSIKHTVESNAEVAKQPPGNAAPKGSSDPVGVEDIPKVKQPQKIESKVELPKLDSAPPKPEVVETHEVVKPDISVEHKVSSEDIVLEQEVQNSKIELNYKDVTASESSDIGKITIELDESTGKKGAGLLAGAAGLGALGKGTASVGNVPQVNGMAASEMINSGVATPSTGGASMLVDGNVTASPSGGGVQTNNVSHSTAGSEATSDRGSISNNNVNGKTNSTSVSGRGGSTLEDKDPNKNESSYGKPNKPDEVNTNDKKGMLGEASIAELDAKDEKEIKVATGVTAGTVVSAGVLAIANVLPWIMLVLALIAIAGYIAYRIKKKKNKDKRRAMLLAQKESEAANATVTLEAVKNVSDVVVSTPVVEATPEVQTESTAVSEVVPAPAPIVSAGSEFSEQPYEPSRDGVTEITPK